MFQALFISSLYFLSDWYPSLQHITHLTLPIYPSNITHPLTFVRSAEFWLPSPPFGGISSVGSTPTSRPRSLRMTNLGSSVTTRVLRKAPVSESMATPNSPDGDLTSPVVLTASVLNGYY